MQRPNLENIHPETLAYIEWLEAELERARADGSAAESEPRGEEPPLEPEEAPAPFSIVTLAESGLARRVPRHLYLRQRRGGTGSIDADWPEAPAIALVHTAERGHLLILTNRARAFRLPAYFLDDAQLRATPKPFIESLPLAEGERWACALAVPENPTGHLAVVSTRGWVRVLPAHIFGETMREGMSVFKVEEFGEPVAADWTGTPGDFFIATRRGIGVRFPAKTVNPQGGVGIRLESGDAVVGVCGVQESSGVFLLSADGKGTIRLMSGFGANKAPGAGGKQAIKTDELIAACTVNPEGDAFILSRTGKLIRFKAAEIPPKEGVVQGVVCMSLRADKPLAVAMS
jgi:DNA gyrase subunit A